jgi:SsrA-binding protein
MAKEKERFAKTISIKNKRATFDFEILDTWVAGIVLKGTEIKSIREGKVSLSDSYCYFTHGELFTRGIQITPYAQGTHYNHEADRERKLLLKGVELRKLYAKSTEKGLTIIPLRIFINDRGFAKLEIGIARGKKNFDKRDSIKSKDVARDMARMRY